MYTGLDVKYPLFLLDFNETKIFSADFRTNIKKPFLNENRSIGSQAVSC
jgi:hypothetical protein